MKKTFYGWWVVAGAFLTFGLSVGLPYYNIPFFYDYFAKANGWRTVDVTRGFFYATLLTLWVGPVIIPRFSPRKLIVVGTGLMALAFICFGVMGSNIWVYWGIWVIYAVGYFLSGPIPHQIIISNWFRKRRGIAMGILYVGVGLMGSMFARLVKPLTEGYDFHRALIILGGVVLLAWPLAILVLRDRPAEKSQYPDGADAPAPEVTAKPRSFAYLFGRYSFWLLVFGSMCSIGSLGAVNFLMKLIFKENFDRGITDPAQAQTLLNATWEFTQAAILLSSIGGRLIIGGLSDAYSKKWVMATSYFLSAITIPLLLGVHPPTHPWFFSSLFGFAMGADYMLIPLMAAEQFGVNTLPRAMAVILPANTISQTGFPALIAVLQEHFGRFTVPMYIVFGVGILSSLSIAVLPGREKAVVEEGLLLGAEGNAKR
jgi:MFS family permease